jgi:transcriptional repressor NrdR
MRCPFCSAQDTRVVDSRLATEGTSVRRRRECIDCGARFTTYESAEVNVPRIVKRDGRREAYDEEKLRAGMMRALEKRPVDTEDVEAAVERIRRSLISAGEREVSTQQLGDWVMAELRQLDEVAYVRFASVYRCFEDVQAFLDVIERLEKELPEKQTRQRLSLLHGTRDTHHFSR